MKEEIRMLASLWSPTKFSRQELSVYAEQWMLDDTRKGMYMLGSVSLLLLSASACVYSLLGFDPVYGYTCLALAVLSLHTAVSARAVRELKALHLLGMTLLVVSGMAFVLVAHETGVLNTAVFASVVLLFMVVPLVPWGLREATIVVSLIYLIFTLSSLSVWGRFDAENLWLLQFFMLGAGFATLSVIARGVHIRRHDIKTRYELEDAHRRLHELSYKDALTGAWNRRFMDGHFVEVVNRCRETNCELHFALIDVDDFKQLNDSCGHDYGDLVLQRLVFVFGAQFPAQGYTIRMGGDEFALLFSAREPEKIIKDGVEALQCDAKLFCEGNKGKVQLSTGLVSIDVGREVRLDALYAAADKALYRAKSKQGTVIGQSHLVAQLAGCAGYT